MILARVLAHARFQYYRHGWPAAFGLALLAIAVGGQTLAVPALQAQTAIARETQEHLSKRNLPSPNAQDASQAQYSALLASLPKGANTSLETVKALHHLAATHGVRLATGEYRLARESGDTLQRYQITLPASASYPKLRAWLTEVMNETPALALDEIGLRREDAGSDRIEARLRFTLFVRKH